MSESHGWEKLRKAACQLRAEGEDGFEGLVAALFEAETGKPFYVARKGDQPVGDAYSPGAGVAVQAKRYTTSRISENEVEGDIHRALRDAPALDVFIVASTKPSAQLAARLAQITNETGVDILFLVLADGLRDFGALCLAHLEVLQRFLPKLTPDWKTWAVKEQLKPDTQHQLESLRQRLCGLATWQFLGDVVRSQIIERFRGEGPGARMHNRILLAQAIPRPATGDRLREWWAEPKAMVAVLEGEEGTGKTWVAAAFAESLYASGNPIILWLDSLTWAQTTTVERLFQTALERLIVGDEKLRQRILRKIFHQWHAPVLLVLDGANERGAWNTADAVLQDYFTHQNQLCGRVRLLFTSRPLSRRARATFWTNCLVVPVGPFSDAEFKAALDLAAPDVSPDDLTRAVKELAIIPRYFALCIRLRQRLVSLNHLTKELHISGQVNENLLRPAFKCVLQGKYLWVAA